MGGINIDTTEAEQAKLTNRLLKELCITYDLSNLVTESTSITYTHESSIDVILTNRKQSFMLSKAVETGLSDFHKMVTTFMHNTYSRQEPIKIFYRNYSNFDKTKFIEDFERSNHYSSIVYGGTSAFCSERLKNHFPQKWTKFLEKLYLLKKSGKLYLFNFLACVHWIPAHFFQKTVT